MKMRLGQIVKLIVSTFIFRVHNYSLPSTGLAYSASHLRSLVINRVPGIIYIRQASWLGIVPIIQIRSSNLLLHHSSPRPNPSLRYRIHDFIFPGTFILFKQRFIELRHFTRRMRSHCGQLGLLLSRIITGATREDRLPGITLLIRSARLYRLIIGLQIRPI